MNKYHLNNSIFTSLSWEKSGKGPCIVLIHGFPEDANLWREIVPALSEKYTVITPDLPGAGTSIYDKGELTVNIMGEAIKFIIEQERVSKVIIAGHSMGGYVALAFAAQYPQYLAGLSLVHSTAFADDAEKKQTRTKTIELLKKNGGKNAFVRQMVPNLFSQGFSLSNAAKVEEQIDLANKITAANMIAFTAAMRDRQGKTDLLPTLNFPVQWILGKDDNIISLSSGIQQSALSDVSFLSVYEHCGHMSMIEQPEKLIKDLSEFTDFCALRNVI